jgi:hypothetical protein
VFPSFSTIWGIISLNLEKEESERRAFLAWIEGL